MDAKEWNSIVDTLHKDWYLVCINPWYRTYANHKTKQLKHIRYRE